MSDALQQRAGALTGVIFARFLSLKWKALVLTSLLLFALTGAFLALSHSGLQQQFEAERAEIERLYEVEMENIIQQSLLKLEGVAAIVPKLSGMRSTLLSQDPDQLRRIFDFHWPLIRDQMRVSVLRFYNPESRVQGSWEREGLQEPLEKIKQWVSEVNESRKVIRALDCSSTCARYVAVPIDVEGHYYGVLVLGSTLGDIAWEFAEISGNRALLITDTDEPDSAESYFSGFTLLADGDPNPNPSAEQDSLLEKLAERRPDLDALTAGFTLEVTEMIKRKEGELRLPRDVVYDVAAIRTKGTDVNAPGYIILFNDITNRLEDIRNIEKKSRYFAIGAIVVAELMLLALLWRPMTHLRRTASALPLLGKGAFAQVREALAYGGGDYRFRDEADVLRDTAHEVAGQLELLEEQVSDRTEALAVRMRELTAERDFVHSLLDTAHVIVLTQNRAHEIVMINRYGQMLSGYSETDLSKTVFERFIETDGSTENFSGLVSEVISGERDFLRHEARLRCKDGSIREIAWLHSKLGPKSHDRAVVLSVGLDITERKQAEVRLSWLADHDPLSGLINRRRFQQELQRALSLVKRHDQAGALLFFDLDHFKYVNDASGHHAGDMLLKLIAHTVTKVVRSSDIVARVGGDEFAVLMEQTDEAGAVQAAQKIIKHLGAINFPVRGRSHKVAASIGIALFPAHGTDINDLLAVADLAMYQAKESGRDTWHLFSPDDLGRERMHAHVYWKEQVGLALAADRFVMHYQPIVNLRTRKISHYEALLRMIDSAGKLVMPDSFISSCEHSGLIHKIDHMVLEKTIHHARDMASSGLDCGLAINLSARAFEDSSLFRVLKKLLADTQIEPERLIFEITETAAVADFAAARGMMKSIRDLGCRFSLDDFGVGFASFYSLKQLPVDYVKIDGSFIRNIVDHKDDQIFVRAMTEIVRGFGKQSIAEYVESDAAAKILAEYGVDYAQGFHVGKPVPIELLLEKAEVIPLPVTQRQPEVSES